MILMEIDTDGTTEEEFYGEIGGLIEDEYDDEVDQVTKEHRQLTDGSISVNPKTCVIRFKPGHTYTRSITLLNTTARPQIIQITRSPEGKVFKFSDPTVMSGVFTIPPNGSWDLPFTFTSRSNQEYKSFLYLTNPTGQGNLQEVELRAIPKSHSSLPKTISFGNVDVGTSVSRKFRLAPESNPYQFRIFIPRGSEGLCVNPTSGKVFSDSPVDVTVVYSPQLCITLCIDLILYLSRGNQSPQVITLTAVTKPKTNRTTTTKNDKRITTKVIHIPPAHRPLNRNKTEKEITVFNRLTMNKMLIDKQALLENRYAFQNPLGESDGVYRESYAQDCNDFMVKANRFGDEHNTTFFKIPRCEPVATDEQWRCVTEKREVEWDAYEEKLYSYQNVLCDDQLEPLGLRERSIRTNCFNDSRHDFDPDLDDNWCMRFQAYNKFITAVKAVIIKNRLEKRLHGFKELMDNHLI